MSQSPRTGRTHGIRREPYSWRSRRSSASPSSSACSRPFFDFPSITLDADGFEVRKWTRLRRSWKDVDGFEAEWFQRLLRVTYVNTGPATGALRVYQWIFGNTEALSYTYGYGRRDFARLLTQWRERALASSR